MQEPTATNPATDAVDESNIFMNPIHAAVLKEDLKSMETLQKRGVDLNEIENGQTPLHLAVIKHKTGAIKKLISLGANLSTMNCDGFTPLHLAVLYNSVSVIKDLVGPDKANTDLYACKGFTALHLAIHYRNVEAVRALLEEGADSELLDLSGASPLHVAVSRCYYEVIDVVLQYVNDPNIPDWTTSSPLHLAASCNDIDALRRIGRHYKVRLNYRNADGDTALHIAIKLQNYEAVEELINLGANVNLGDGEGFLPIYLAVMYDSIDAILILQQSGSDINCINEDGNTALHQAVIRNDMHALNILCRLGADLDLRNVGGNTPLLTAIEAENSHATKLLLHYVADVDVCNRGGKTPLHVAACLGNEYNIKKLIRFGASLHTYDTSGEMPLHSAANMDNVVGIETLLKYGAIPSNKTRYGKTALDIVMEHVEKRSFIAARLFCDYDLPFSTDKILESAKVIIRFEILENFKNSKLNNPEYLLNTIPIIKSYVKDCFTEVRMMKSTLLHKDLCFHSFVMHGWQRSMPLNCNCSSEVALNHLIDVRITKEYPIYRDEILSKLERSALLKKVECLGMYASSRGKSFNLNFYTVALIVDHLSNGDILNLILAYSELDAGVNISKLSNANKRKVDESAIDSSSVNEKSNKINRIKKARNLKPKSLKKTQPVVVNSLERSDSNNIITRSISNSKTSKKKKCWLLK